MRARDGVAVLHLLRDRQHALIRVERLRVVADRVVGVAERLQRVAPAAVVVDALVQGQRARQQLDAARQVGLRHVDVDQRESAERLTERHGGHVVLLLHLGERPHRRLGESHRALEAANRRRMLLAREGVARQSDQEADRRQRDRLPFLAHDLARPPRHRRPPSGAPRRPASPASRCGCAIHPRRGRTSSRCVWETAELGDCPG